MKSWNSSPHPISDIREWQNSGRLEIRPDFQRKEVWSEAAKIMLMDTIIRAIPMPKIFVSSTLKDDQVYRTVIDGQQRTSAILSFLRDAFPLEKPYVGEFRGLFFSQLPTGVRNSFLQYRIDFNEAIEFSDEELRETYSRLNKYSVALTKQELRRADFPGDFLRLSESLALLDFFETSKIFTVANRRRSADVEFVSELLAGLLAGPQDKRDTLDSFYLSYSSWDIQQKDAAKNRFMGVLADLGMIFSDDLVIHSTRFRQKADFYSLTLAVDELRRSGGSIEGLDLAPLREDLKTLDQLIAPESECKDCRDYAIKCVSQANSYSSRRWRMGFLKNVLGGTYLRRPPLGDGAVLFYRISTTDFGGGMCPPPEHECSECDVSIDPKLEEIIAWHKNASVFQMSNATRIHRECGETSKWCFITGEDSDKDLTFDQEESPGPV
ncbi:MAG: DUF262 domain-containing protein [Candidatus Accumulibacter sp.]|uniref:DUF262 domain-containing protein n=1 Tax=Candidatus Accumulibacter proximus TaxID=2954385 RepID=A0A935Q3Z7_9PROT|nr:DUF262 domain-containing protein [Candidatus Accumulibacter proximus]